MPWHGMVWYYMPYYAMLWMVGMVGMVYNRDGPSAFYPIHRRVEQVSQQPSELCCIEQSCVLTVLAGSWSG